MSDHHWNLGHSAKARDEVVAELNLFLRGYNLLHMTVHGEDSMAYSAYARLGMQPVTVVGANRRNLGYIYVPIVGIDFHIPAGVIMVAGEKREGVVDITGTRLTIAYPYIPSDSMNVVTRHHVIVQTKPRD